MSSNLFLATLAGFSVGVYITWKVTSSLMGKPQVKRKSDHQNGIIYMIDTVDHLTSIKDVFSPTANAFDQPFYVSELIQKVPKNVHIKLVICTRGGDLTNCEKILNQLQKHPAGYTAYIKNECFSAGTILALGAKEIIMTEDSYLGKIDPQISIGTSYYSAVIFNALKDEHITDRNIYLVKRSAQAINQIENLLQGLPYSDETRQRIREHMIYSEYPHNKSFSLKECQNIGLNIRQPTNVEKSILDFSLSS
jgi:hypothetical protein